MAIARAILALLVCSGIGAANSIIVQNLDNALGTSTLWISESNTNKQLDWTGGIYAKVDAVTRVVWCVQLLVGINLNTTYNTVVDWADTANLQRVGWMMQNVVAGVTTTTQGAAFQLAIWDIIEDNGDGFNTGNVAKSTSALHPTDAAVLAQAIAYENQSVGKAFKYVPVYHNTMIGNGTPVQNLIGPLTYDGGVDSMAPEPRDFWMMLGGLALIGLGRSARYFRRGSRRSASVSM